MKARLLAVLGTAMLLIASAPAWSGESGLGCPGPFGPVFGYPDAGLYTIDMISDSGGKVGEVDVFNTNEILKFVVRPDSRTALTAVQLWTGDDLSTVPVKDDGKPHFGKFPIVNSLKLKKGEAHQVVLNLKDEPLNFSWQGQTKHWGFMLHGDFGGKSFTAMGPCVFADDDKYRYSRITLAHPDRGHFIDVPVRGISYKGPTQEGITGTDIVDGQWVESDRGGFLFFPDEEIAFGIGSKHIGIAPAAKKVSPLDLFAGADADDPRVIGVARTLQTLDSDPVGSKIVLQQDVVQCFVDHAGLIKTQDDWGNVNKITTVLEETLKCAGRDPAAIVSVAEAQANLESGLNASGIFRKNISKTEDWGEDKHKEEIMPVYFPGLRSDGSPSMCIDVDEDGIYTEGVDTPGVPYEEWRLYGEPDGESCDPRVDGEACVITLIECRDVANPLLVTYLGKVDIYDDQVTTAFWPGRFSYDVYTAISRDDGTTWKRMNNSRMADMSSIELETGEPFPGTSGSPYLKVNDNQILVVWESKFCKSGNPRYSIELCDNPATAETPTTDPVTGETVCEEYCRGNAEQGTEVCEPDYAHDDDYYVTDIWGVRGQQESVDYNEVDDVAELGIGEIPYSCLWAQRGMIASQKELDEGTFDSMTIIDDNDTPDNPDDDFERSVVLGDIVWYKPERLTSGRRDVYIPMVGSARKAGFAIAWQEDPSGLRPGKGKGPGEGWSGAISNHKTDIWYSFISYDDFSRVDENFIPGGPGGGTDGVPTGDEGYLDKPGLGRPKALVPFSLPVRISDNDMVNTNTLKVEPGTTCVTPPGGTEPVCFPEVVDGSFVPIDPEEIAKEFCGHPEADPASCCDPDNHEGDPNCEDLKGFFGNLNGTKRYAYMARSIDEIDNDTGLFMLGGDGVPDYQYYVDNGGTLDFCDVSASNGYMDALPGTTAHERWFGFANAAGASKLVCVSSDGRLLDGDVSASRPMLQLQPYTRPNGTTGAWALLAYEESKGLGHSLAAEEHLETDNPVDEIIGDPGQDKPIKQDLGKNMIYHSFDFAQPDLVSAGHIVNLPALCGGLYPTYCDDPKTPDVIETDAENPTCTCSPGQPIPLYFDELVDRDGDPATPDEWLPDVSKFLQYRTEIARRARFIVQGPGKVGPSKTLGTIIYKQGQEGQGRPADVFIRRIVKAGTGNPYKFENFECTTYLDQTFSLPACPNGNGDMPSAVGYSCNVWGEASGDRLCGGTFTDPSGYPRRDHINLTSSDVDLAVDAGPDDDTPDDPTDDRYGTNKVLLWSQHERNLGDESYGFVDTDGTPCAVTGWERDPVSGAWTNLGTPEVCPAMYSNARSHRGFIRGDLLVTAYSLSPNWASGRNGNDRYNFYVRRSFDGGQTWTTTPGALGGQGVYLCPEYRSDPNNPDPDGSGNLPPQLYLDSVGTCGTSDLVVEDGELPPLPVGIASTHYLYPMGTTADGLPAQFIPAGAFEPARNVSEIKSNKTSSGDPRIGATPPTFSLDGSVATLPRLDFIEDTYADQNFFVAWGTVDNPKSTGSSGEKPEGSPLDLYYTRSPDYGDTYMKVPWVIGGENSNLGYGETVWRYDFLAKGEPEQQGECQLRATSDGSKVYAFFHSAIAEEDDPDAAYSRWYPWRPETTHEDDLWFRRVIFWPDEVAVQ